MMKDEDEFDVPDVSKVLNILTQIFHFLMLFSLSASQPLSRLWLYEISLQNLMILKIFVALLLLQKCLFVLYFLILK